MTGKIRYALNETSADDIYFHLLSCDPHFVKELSAKTDLQDYSKKMFDRAIRFEAWNDSELVGLVAAYFNDLETMTGFITNVSVSKKSEGKGIASQLMKNCLDYAKEYNFKRIRLEVGIENNNAIKLYNQHLFKITGEASQNLTMEVALQ